MAAQLAKMDGLPFVEKQLESFLPRESRAILRRTTAKIAVTVKKKMRDIARRMTGNLRKAIVSKRMRGSRNTIEAGVFITQGRQAKRDAFYWYFIEFGTKHFQPKPFIAPAYQNLQAGYPAIFRSEFGRQLEKQLEKRAKTQRIRK